MKKSMKYLLSGAVIGSALALGSCSKSNDALPAIDGYNNSNEVGAANLVAHWTFDDNNNEVISGTAPSNTYGTVGSTTGPLGKALQLTKGVLVFPTIDKINSANALNNFTISLWVNVKGNKRNTDGTAGFTSFFGIFPKDDADVWPNLGAMAETVRHLPNSDTLELKNYLSTTLPDNSQSNQDNVALLNTDAPGTNANAGTGSYFMGAGKWSHYVMRWDGTTHQFHIFANGVSVGGYTDRGTTPVEVMRVPAITVFGSLASSDIGFPNASTQPDWNPWATASIDDVRVFNTSLADKDVKALFNLGTAGR